MASDSSGWPAEATDGLVRRLEKAASPATREHWEAYLKGQAAFRGVPMAGVRSAVRSVWRHHRLDERSTEDLLALAQVWFAQTASEDKLAAILLIAEHLAPRLTLAHDAALAAPLVDGHVADWNVCDWYATKALHAFLDGPEVESRARALAAWTSASGLWHRRAGLVAFVKLAGRLEEPFPGFVGLVLHACAANLVSTERFAQTGPGWVLRELSKHHPEAVSAFVAAHEDLAPEARRMATARLRSGPYRRR